MPSDQIVRSQTLSTPRNRGKSRSGIPSCVWTTPPSGRASRGALPAHLPRIEVTLTPEDTACPCCRATMTVIGEDTSERLDVIPAQFGVIVTRRPKLACRSCSGIVVQRHRRRAAADRGRHPDRGDDRTQTRRHHLVAMRDGATPGQRLVRRRARQGVTAKTVRKWRDRHQAAG